MGGDSAYFSPDPRSLDTLPEAARAGRVAEQAALIRRQRRTVTGR
jgi:hypothetical protein